MPDRPRVVVVGAGFGGLAAAKALADAPVDLTLVDQVNYHTFQPLLYEVATAGLGADDIAHNVRGIVRGHGNTTFCLSRVVGVEWEPRRLLVEDGGHVPFDFLILAAGAVTATYGVPGVEEHGYGLKSLPDAIRLRNHVLSQFERVAADPSLVAEGALTFVVAGGGATGVEMAGALAELFQMVLVRDFGPEEASHARVVLVEATDRLLGAFRPRLGRQALATLASRGVDVRLDRTIERVTDREVVFKGGEVLPAHTLVWSAGVRANPLADTLGLEQGRAGRVVVDADLSVPGRPEVFVIGDMAAAAGPDGQLLPQVAPVAIQGARHAAAQIRARLEGRPSAPFRYKDRGAMATIGRHAAVAELPIGLAFGGFPAWSAWLGLHLVQLIGFRNRVNVLTNWAWRYITYDRGARLILEPYHEGGEGDGAG